MATKKIAQKLAKVVNMYGRGYKAPVYTRAVKRNLARNDRWKNIAVENYKSGAITKQQYLAKIDKLNMIEKRLKGTGMTRKNRPGGVPFGQKTLRMDKYNDIASAYRRKGKKWHYDDF